MLAFVLNLSTCQLVLKQNVIKLIFCYFCLPMPAAGGFKPSNSGSWVDCSTIVLLSWGQVEKKLYNAVSNFGWQSRPGIWSEQSSNVFNKLTIQPAWTWLYFNTQHNITQHRVPLCWVSLCWLSWCSVNSAKRFWYKWTLIRIVIVVSLVRIGMPRRIDFATFVRDCHTLKRQ